MRPHIKNKKIKNETSKYTTNIPEVHFLFCRPKYPNRNVPKKNHLAEHLTLPYSYFNQSAEKQVLKRHHCQC